MKSPAETRPPNHSINLPPLTADGLSAAAAKAQADAAAAQELSAQLSAKLEAFQLRRERLQGAVDREKANLVLLAQILDSERASAQDARNRAVNSLGQYMDMRAWSAAVVFAAECETRVAAVPSQVSEIEKRVAAAEMELAEFLATNADKTAGDLLTAARRGKIRFQAELSCGRLPNGEIDPVAHERRIRELTALEDAEAKGAPRFREVLGSFFGKK